MPQATASQATVRMPDGRMLTFAEALAEVRAQGPLQRPGVPDVTETAPAEPVTREQLRNVALEALPLGAGLGLAATGVGIPASMGLMAATGAGTEGLKAGLAGQDLSDPEVLENMLLRGAGEGALEALGPGLGLLGRGLTKLGVHAASGVPQAFRFSNAVKGPHERPVNALMDFVDQLISARTPFTERGIRRADRLMLEAGDETAEALQEEAARALPDPFRQSRLTSQRRRLERQASRGVPVDEGLRRTAEMEADLAQEIEEAMRLQAQADEFVDEAGETRFRELGDVLRELLPQSGLMGGPGQMTTRASLSGIGGGAALLGGLSPEASAAITALLFAGTSPSNLTRVGIPLGQLGRPGLRPVTTGLKAAARTRAPLSEAMSEDDRSRLRRRLPQ